MAQRKPYVKKFQAAFNKALFAARVEVLAKLERHAKSIPSLQNSTTPIPRSVASDFLFNLHDFTGKLFAAVRPPTEQSFLAAGNAVLDIANALRAALAAKIGALPLDVLARADGAIARTSTETPARISLSAKGPSSPRIMWALMPLKCGSRRISASSPPDSRAT